MRDFLRNPARLSATEGSPIDPVLETALYDLGGQSHFGKIVALLVGAGAAGLNNFKFSAEKLAGAAAGAATDSAVTGVPAEAPVVSEETSDGGTSDWSAQTDDGVARDETEDEPLPPTSMPSTAGDSSSVSTPPPASPSSDSDEFVEQSSADEAEVQRSYTRDKCLDTARLLVSPSRFARREKAARERALTSGPARDAAAYAAALAAQQCTAAGVAGAIPAEGVLEQVAQGQDQGGVDRRIIYSDSDYSSDASDTPGDALPNRPP